MNEWELARERSEMLGRQLNERLDDMRIRQSTFEEETKQTNRELLQMMRELNDRERERNGHISKMVEEQGQHTVYHTEVLMPAFLNARNELNEHTKNHEALNNMAKGRSQVYALLDKVQAKLIPVAALIGGVIFGEKLL